MNSNQNDVWESGGVNLIPFGPFLAWDKKKKIVIKKWKAEEYDHLCSSESWDVKENNNSLPNMTFLEHKQTYTSNSSLLLHKVKCTWNHLMLRQKLTFIYNSKEKETCIKSN